MRNNFAVLLVSIVACVLIDGVDGLGHFRSIDFLNDVKREAGGKDDMNRNSKNTKHLADDITCSSVKDLSGVKRM